MLVCFALFVSLLLGFASLSRSSAEEAQFGAGVKVLTINDGHVNAPVEITGVWLEGGRPIKSGVPFRADEDWLQDLRVGVRNLTDQPIKSVIFALDFPTEHNGQPMSKRLYLEYGQDAFRLQQDAPDRTILAHGTEVVHFNSNDPLAYDSFKVFRNKDYVPRNTWDRGELTLYTVNFLNRAWYMGLEFDRTNDGKWVKDKDAEKRMFELKKAKQEKEKQQGFLERLSNPFDFRSAGFGVNSLFARSSSRKAFASCYTAEGTGQNLNCTAAAACPTAGCTYFRPPVVNCYGSVC